MSSNFPDIPVELIWGAACQALSTNNGEYIKPEDVMDKTFVKDELGKQTNRELIEFYAFNTDKISEQSIKDGEEIRNYLKGMLFKMLSEELKSDYFIKLIKLATDDELKLKSSNIGYIASAPNAVIREQFKEGQLKKVKECDPGYVGRLHESVQLNFRIIKSHYSEDWERYYITAITTDNKLITYSTKNRRLIGVDTIVTATANVKAHFIDQYTKHETTKLNNVRTGIK